MPTEPHQERETRRVILLRGTNPEVLVGFDGAHPAFPQVEIPRWQRVAENLTAAVRENCGIHAVSLSSLEAPPAESSSQQIHYEIMEPCGPADEAPRGKHWVAIGGLLESAFRDVCDFQAVRQAIAQVMVRSEDTAREPFGRLGWYPELQRWVQEQIGTQGLHLNGRFRQINACPSFSLIRFETEGPAVWFKAVGAPNQREYPLTLALARYFSRFVPQVIATRPECNGWLAREAEGSLLNESSTLPSWGAAAQDLAELQISSLGQSLHLLELGARDLRTWALADFVEPFFRAMNEVMKRQAKMPPAPLSHEELHALSARLREALIVFEEAIIPATLGHLDLNPGNIVCSPPVASFSIGRKPLWGIPSSLWNICCSISAELSDWITYRRWSLSLATSPHGVRFFLTVTSVALSKLRLSWPYSRTQQETMCGRTRRNSRNRTVRAICAVSQGACTAKPV